MDTVETTHDGVAPGQPGAGEQAEIARHDVFLSYSHADRPFAISLRDELVGTGKRVWVDESDIPPAARWESELKRAIQISDTFVFVMSPHSIASPECLKEVRHAVALNKRILPVNYRQPDMHAIPAELGPYQFIPGRGEFDADRSRSLAQLLEAIDTDLEWVREHTDWTLKATEWVEHDRDDSFLIAGSELDAAEAWLARQVGKVPAPTPLQTEFVLLSRRRSLRRARRTRAATSTALAIVTVLAVIAFILRGQAVNESQLSSSRALAANSLLQLTSDPQLSLLLAVSSAQVRHTSEALDALRRAVPANHLLQTFSDGDGRPDLAAALSPDGTMVAAASADHVIRVWTTGGRLLRVLRGHQGEILGVSFDPSSARLLSWAEDGTARIWDLRGSRAPIILRSTDYRVVQAEFSPDGKRVVAAFFIGAPVVFDAGTGRALFSLGRGGQGITIATYDSGGRYLATGGSGSRVSFWRAGDGGSLGSLDAGSGSGASAQVSVLAARFSPAGLRMVISTTNAEDTVSQSRIWDLTTGNRLTPAMSGGDPAWSPDGRYLTTTAGEQVQFWQASDGKLLRTLHGADPIAGAAVISGNGAAGAPRFVLTGSQDGTADLWDPSTGEAFATLVGTHGAVTPVAFSRGADTVLTFGSDGTARLWSTGVVTPQPAGLAGDVAGATGMPPASQLVPDGAQGERDRNPVVPVAAFYSSHGATIYDTRSGARLAQVPFPGGRGGEITFDVRGRIALVMGSGPAQIRSARTGRLLHALSGTGSLAQTGAVSPDGRLVAAADGSDRVGVWDVASGRQLVRFDRHRPQKDVITALVMRFSPDSSLLVSTDQSGISYVWRARTGVVLNRIVGAPPPSLQYDEVMSAAISPDDRLVVTASAWDNDAHVYQVGHAGQLIALQGHSDGIQDVTFSPDGSLIATTTEPGGLGGNCNAAFVGSECDDSTRVWDTQHSSQLLTLSDAGGTRVAFSADGASLLVNRSFPYDTLTCSVCGGFGRMIPLAEHAEVTRLSAEQRVAFHVPG